MLKTVDLRNWSDFPRQCIPDNLCKTRKVLEMVVRGLDYGGGLSYCRALKECRAHV